MKLDTYLDNSQSIELRDSKYSIQRFNPIGYLFQGLCKPNKNRRAYLKGPLSSYLNKEVEKEKSNSRELHKVFFFF